jgi:adenylate cyclase
VKRGLTLRNRILLTLGMLVTSILAISSALNIAAGHRERLRALRLRAALVAEAEATALANPIWDYDQDAGLAALKGQLEDPEFVVAAVTDDAGQPFTKLERPGSDGPEGELEIARRDVKMPVANGETRRIGSVELRFARHLVQKALRAEIVRALLVLVVLVLVVSATMAIGLKRFTRPIEEMTRVIRRRASGDLSLDVDPAWLGRDDEIGAIAQSLELDQQQRRDEAKLLEITSHLSSEMRVEDFLRSLADAGRDLLEAERCMVFVHDRRRDLLWSEQGVDIAPSDGVVGRAFTTGELIRLDSPSVLCAPMATKAGARVGVIEVLNRRGGPFTERDELRLRALAAQAAVALDNARLLDDVLDEKSYNESILASLTDAVVSVGDGLRVERANAAACRLLNWQGAEVGRSLRELLPDQENDFEIEVIDRVARSGQAEFADDTDLCLADGRLVSVNLKAVPLAKSRDGAAGTLVVLEDITADKRVRGTIARYLPKKVVDQLLHGDRAALGGTSQTITALFTDIRGFTTLSEAIGPRDTVTMLNEYFTEMMDVLDRHNGVLDKFIGDAIMAIFGVPFTAPDDADSALATANEMIAALSRHNEVRRQRGQPPLAMGAGLNTGEAVAGNIGSPKRMAYTVIGDSVNLASRLEAATKHYGAAVLLSEFTFRALRQPSFVREVDIIRVKGKTVPVAVYESYAHRADRDSDPFRRAIDRATDGMRAFRTRRWSDAAKLFLEAQTLAPGDKLPAIYLERVQRYQAAPPPDDWDGVWEMTSK